MSAIEIRAEVQQTGRDFRVLNHNRYKPAFSARAGAGKRDGGSTDLPV